jgi:hypothetical protein
MLVDITVCIFKIVISPKVHRIMRGYGILAYTNICLNMLHVEHHTCGASANIHAPGFPSFLITVSQSTMK